ncbi:hypothetical protein RDWZM_006685 [Blomia tropicalis]|uniref:Eukaryotic translation initiation factor 3 subunit K n=1 Tax=Blomia tropicalis TaxID=40697 RepID=A0A9Q0M900_BLOTA|nr:Eukaryotic translation initiation factor 3 subunit K [Blomia tropicalis]KAJ6220873.1 hypothetical protein RDWZM_006685 [Blomia tropicalis]
MGDSKKAKVRSMLCGIELYNPHNIEVLHEYLNEQCAENTYDLEANLAILRLYQFNTEHVDKKVIIKILLKALTALPSPDFGLCKGLIDPAYFEEEEIDPHLKHVLHLHQLLEICDFKQFWIDLRSDPGVYLGIAGFDDSIRQYICYVVRITYQTIDKASLCELLGGLDDSQLKYWLQVNKWKDEEDGYVFISNQEELIKSKNIKEKIEFDSIARVVAAYK